MAALQVIIALLALVALGLCFVLVLGLELADARLNILSVRQAPGRRLQGVLGFLWLLGTLLLVGPLTVLFLQWFALGFSLAIAAVLMLALQLILLRIGASIAKRLTSNSQPNLFVTLLTPKKDKAAFAGVFVRAFSKWLVATRPQAMLHLEEDPASPNATITEELVENVQEFENLRVKDCMVPRTEMVAVEENDTLDNLRQLFIETGHSRIFVFRGNKDTVIGYVHHLDLYKKPSSIADIIWPVTFASQFMPARELLYKLLEKQRSIAVVVDEFGGTAGLVTIEDIIEQITGNIEDEYDTEGLTEIVISENEWLFSARLEIDYINEEYGLPLPEDEAYETLGGLIYLCHQNVPNIGDVIDLGTAEAEILSMQQARLEVVRLRLKPRADGEAE